MMSSSTVPLISVIIPAYNAEQYIAEAIESVIAQKYSPIEIIVVDDGSTDNTQEIVKSFPEIHYIYQSNQGPASARNAGIKIAKGDLICFIDADDLWHENKIEKQLSLLEENPDAGIILGYLQFVKLADGDEGQKELIPFSIPWPGPSLGNATIRKSIFSEVGLLDESQKYSDDTDWFIRAQEKGISILVHPDVTYYYRRHANNITNQVENSKYYLLRAVKLSLDRRRDVNGKVSTILPTMFDFDFTIFKESLTKNDE